MIVFELTGDDTVSIAATVAADATLEHTLETFGMSKEETLAVVDDLDSRRLCGVVHHRDVLLAYNRALLEAHAEEHDEQR